MATMSASKGLRCRGAKAASVRQSRKRAGSTKRMAAAAPNPPCTSESIARVAIDEALTPWKDSVCLPERRSCVNLERALKRDANEPEFLQVCDADAMCLSHWLVSVSHALPPSTSVCVCSSRREQTATRVIDLR